MRPCSETFGTAVRRRLNVCAEPSRPRKKMLALLCPREHKVEHSNALKNLSDEQLEAMIAYLETSLAAQASGSVKVIEGMIEPTTVPATALPVLEPPKRKPNRLMMEVDTAIGPQERKPRKRKAPLPTGG